MYDDETYGKITEGMTDTSDSSSTVAPDSVTSYESAPQSDTAGAQTTGQDTVQAQDSVAGTTPGMNTPEGVSQGMASGMNASGGPRGAGAQTTDSDTYRAGSYNAGAPAGTYIAGGASGRQLHKEKKNSGGFGKKLLTAFACALVFGVVAGVIIFSIIKIGNKILSNVNIETSHHFETFDPFDDDDDFPKIESTKPIGGDEDT